LVWLIGAFAIATVCFAGSALYADSQFASVVRRSHGVSENAMPSLFRLGVMRRETLEIFFLLDQDAEGKAGAREQLESHWSNLDEAARGYELLPRWPGEGPLWSAGRQQIERLRAADRKVEDEASRQHLEGAAEAEHVDVEPAVRDLDATLGALLRLNRERGILAARDADEFWRRTRRISLTLCGVSVVLTAGLAFSAIRYARRYEDVQRERADELEAFAGRVAHDLLGPLSPATLAIQSLQRTIDEDDPRRRILDRGQRSLHSLESLIFDLLAFARAGARPELGASAPLQDVAGTVVQSLEPQARESGVRLLVDNLPSCTLACGQGVLSSILFNLVGNAIKYMPCDAAEKVVHLRGIQRTGCLVRVEVVDTGRGLPGGDPGRLFNPYVRATHVKPGLGLGLATVRRLVEAHGGRVGARPNEGAGAVFWFEMPVS
jgi:signal transduction histidine kinase